MMKKVFLSLVVAMLANVNGIAQQIAVVKGSATQVCQTLTEAIECAQEGSVIYLPGGGFSIADSVKINKKLTIMGIGHKIDSGNADGNTIIGGNLHFEAGSDGSALIGCYVIGNVNVGNEKMPVNDFTMKWCNVNAVSVGNAQCENMIINQNYVRSQSNFGGAPVKITNNVIYNIVNVTLGIIKNNIVVGGDQNGCAVIFIRNSTIMYNVVFSGYYLYDVRDCIISDNMKTSGHFGQNDIPVELDLLFVNNQGVNPNSDFHFTENYQEYSNIGIYGGTGFSDGAQPPVPFISHKEIAEQTDAAGKLKIFIKVKASDGTMQGGAIGGSEQDQPVNSGDEEGM